VRYYSLFCGCTAGTFDRPLGAVPLLSLPSSHFLYHLSNELYSLPYFIFSPLCPAAFTDMYVNAAHPARPHYSLSVWLFGSHKTPVFRRGRGGRERGPRTCAADAWRACVMTRAAQKKRQAPGLSPISCSFSYFPAYAAVFLSSPLTEYLHIPVFITATFLHTATHTFPAHLRGYYTYFMAHCCVRRRRRCRVAFCGMHVYERGRCWWRGFLVVAMIWPCQPFFFSAWTGGSMERRAVTSPLVSYSLPLYAYLLLRPYRSSTT